MDHCFNTRMFDSTRQIVHNGTCATGAAPTLVNRPESVSVEGVHGEFRVSGAGVVTPHHRCHRITPVPAHGLHQTRSEPWVKPRTRRAKGTREIGAFLP